MTCRTLEDFYHIDGHTFEKQYKETLSDFRHWDQLEHADEWLLFPENIGPRLAIDESSLSNGELYTFVTNREAHTREQSLIAVVAGTKSEDVIAVLQRIGEQQRNAVEEVTLDLSDSMRKIVRTVFPRASRVIDRFHIQKLACDAVQELRIKHRWEAIQQANDEMEESRQRGKDYVPFRYSNGDTRKELLIRSRYLLFKSADKWTDRQKQRAAILFEEYPDIKTAYGLCHSLRMIFSKNTIKDAARLSMARWYNKVEEAGLSGRLVGDERKKLYLCSMDLIRKMASLMLPSSMLEYFEVVKVEESATLIEISLDELYPVEYKNDPNIESKGFMSSTTITDFPIRDHKLLLHVRRRRWIRKDDGVSFCRPIDLTASGTCYSKEFAAFLKETYGEFPSDLPYA